MEPTRSEQSGRLRLRDVRDVYRLVGECRELGRDPVQWRRHLLTGLARLLDAPIAIGGMMTVAPAGAPDRWDYVDVGFAGNAERDKMLQYRDDPRMKAAPTVTRLFSLPGRLVTCTRERLASDREWYQSVEFNEFRRLSGIDGWLVSAFRCPPRRGRNGAARHGEMNLINLHRGLRDRQFSARERRLLHLLHLELGPLLGTSLATSRDEPFGELSPRQRDVLAGLLAGESEKMIAARLSLGVRTVHEYVTALYRRFDVHSRGELMARCARPQPAFAVAK